MGTARSALSSSVSVDAIGDTYVQLGRPDKNAGGDTVLSVEASSSRRSLLFFDKNAIASAVGSARLLSARLELTIFSAGSNWGSGKPISVYRLLQESREGQATWNCAVDSNIDNNKADCRGATDWNMGASDPAQLPWAARATSSVTISSGQKGDISFDVTADVSAVLNGSWPGQGWLLKRTDENQGGSIDFASRERGPGPRLVLQLDRQSGSGGTGPVTGRRSLTVAGDTYIRHAPANQNFSTERSLLIESPGLSRTLLRFDGTTVSNALGGPLVRARLLLPIQKTYSNWGPDRALSAHRMLHAWTDAAATWNCAVDSNTRNQSSDCSGDAAWSMLGSTTELPWKFEPTDTELVSKNESCGSLEFDVTQDVACALAGYGALHGWLIKKAMETQAGKIELDSRETSTPPTLALEWTNTRGVTVTAADCGGETGGCTPTATTDVTCNGVDDDCDGAVDEDYVASTTHCGVGACAADGTTSCIAGHVNDTCSPGAPAANDASCNGIDDNCNAAVDEGYVPTATHCGVGACAATGTTSCSAGHVTDSCAPGTPAASDATCNGIDDNCNGAIDEGFVPSSTHCGLGACAATGTTSCSAGHVTDSCAPGTPAVSDATCNGIDDNCNGAIDEGFAPASTHCGVGACIANGTTSCVAGQIRNSCTPGTPAASDATCNAIDDDCDGSVDEDFVAAATHCGINACAANGTTSCVAGQVIDSCSPGTPAANDSSCNGIDDNCNGVVDEGFVPTATHCGIGACAATGMTSCVAGHLGDSCAPGAPAARDATCNGIDEDFAATSTHCGVGACAASGTIQCTNGQLVDSCSPGTPAASDATCNGIDDNCNGVIDEDFVATSTHCGVGACAASGTRTCVAGHVSDSCTAGSPTGSDDDCNGIDEDCDGTSDDGFVSTPTSCRDGACDATGVTTCTSGVLGCRPETVLPIDDGNPCTSDVCVPATGPVYTPRATGTPCADDNICNGGETCNAAGMCAPGSALVVDDGNPCTTDSCDPSTGIRHVAVAAQTPCDDGNVCNGVSVCNALGVCTPGAAPSADDGNPCTVDGCDPDIGLFHTAADPGTSCADQDLCNGDETCDGFGSCTPGVPLEVDDGRPCTVDFCEPAYGVLHQFGLVDVCDDGDACNGVSYCGPTGECVEDTAPEVDDGNPCTADLCDPTFGVFHQFLAPGTDCEDGDPCNGRETCNELGACAPGTPPNLDDGNPCTINSCSVAGGFENTPAPNGTPCPINDPCLGPGACAFGACEAQPLPIDDGNACTEDSCDPVRGVIHVALPPPDDGDPCTNDECDPSVGGVYTPIADGGSCSDGDLCNGEEACVQGVCTSLPVADSDDGNPCTDDVCDPETGVYAHHPAPDDTACNDPAFCGQAGVCMGGECMFRGERIDDRDPCTEDVCDEVTGTVQHLPEPEGAYCDNGNFCDGDFDSCDADGQCVGSDPPELELTDLGPCQGYACDPVLGFVPAPAPYGTACGERAICNGEGACMGGPSRECDEECAIGAANCGTAFDFESCLQRCVVDSSSGCAEDQALFQECVLEHPDQCPQAACPVHEFYLSECEERDGDADHIAKLNDCLSVFEGEDGHKVILAGADGVLCESFESCGVGICQRGRCIAMQDADGFTQPQCMTQSGPGYCVDSNRNGGLCEPAPGFHNPCYDAEWGTVLPVGTPCNLGVCSEEGTCDAYGRCQARPQLGGTPCEDKAQCTGPGTCGAPNPNLQHQRDHSFECIPDVARPQDADPCTNLVCNTETGQLERRPEAAGVSCDDQNPCNGFAELCDGAGHCSPSYEQAVDDQNPCTIDYACDPVRGFLHTNLPDGTSCSDGDPCNGEELCQAGVCGTGSVSPPGPCVVRSCDAHSGIVDSPAPAGTVCEHSNNPCLQDALCDGAAHCLALQPTPVDDQNPCTIDHCTVDHGVQNDYYLPDDGNPCTISECDPIEGPVQLPASEGTSCSDGNACDGDETCDGAGSCRAGTPLALDDGNPCTIDRCNPLSGVVHEPARGGTTCSDDNACDGEELCDGSGHCMPGEPPPIDDDMVCTEDSCDALGGIRHRWIGGVDCDGPTWETLSASAPSPRDSVAAAFSSTTSELFLFGGENAGVALSDTWLFDLNARTWRRSLAEPPPARAGAVAVYDELNQRIILFGGVTVSSSGTSYFGDIWQYDPIADAWSELDPSSAGPEPRALAAATYDSERERLVVFGGVGSTSALADTWEFDLADGSWLARASDGPSPRLGAALAYDPVRQRTVLFGGAAQNAGSPGTPLNDVWEFDGSAGSWTSVATTNSPSPRTGHGLVYDSARRRLRLYGGVGAQPEALSDTWEYEPASATWQQLAPSLQLPGRAAHAVAYDPATGTTVVSAGLDYSANGLVTPANAEVWRLDAAGSQWRELRAHAAPVATQPGLVFEPNRDALVSVGPLPATDRMVAWEYTAQNQLWQARELASRDGAFRFGVSFVTLGYDVDRQRTLFGTYELATFFTPLLTHIWEWDGTQVSPACNFPQVGVGTSFIYHPGLRKLVAIGGGSDNFDPSEKVWLIDLSSCAIQPGRRGPYTKSALPVWDSRRARVIVLGPFGYGYPGATWVSDTALESWTALNSTLRPPPARGGTMAYDPARARVVWFGQAEYEPSQTWELDTEAGQWQRVPDATGPRAPGSAAFDASRGNVVLLDADGTLWDLRGGNWHAREIVLSPSARDGASAAWVTEGGYGVLFGGVSGSGQRRLLGDTWIWKDGWKPASDLETNDAQRAYDPLDHMSPPARTGHTLVQGSNAQDPEAAVVLFGGEGEAGLLSDTWKFNRDTYEWKPLELTYGAVPARTGHAMAVLPNHGYVMFGGLGAHGALGDTYKLQVPQYRAEWLPDSQVQASVAPRWGHAMATDLERGTVLLFGGRDGDTLFGDTWEYRPDALPRWVQHQPRRFPSARFGHSLVYDPLRHRIVLTGGSGATPGSTFDDTWDWVPEEDTWVQRVPEQRMPARAGHAAFFDETRGELVMFGGLAYADGGRAASSYGDTLALENAGATVDEGVRLPNGARCAHDDECEYSQCVDGYCCNSRCNGQCGACDLPGHEGQCTAVIGPPHGARPACSNAGDCQQCAGVDLNACGDTDGLSCGAAGCSNGVIYSPGTCNAGVCELSRQTSCAPYGCASDSSSCRTYCTHDTDCFSSDYFCAIYFWRSPVGICERLARVRQVDVPPRIRVGDTVTLQAVTEETPAYYEFSYQDASGAWQYPPECSRKYGQRGICSFEARTAGTTTWRVEVTAPDSPHFVDSLREFPVTVLP